MGLRCVLVLAAAITLVVACSDDHVSRRPKPVDKSVGKASSKKKGKKADGSDSALEPGQDASELAAAIFKERCASCHGPDASKGNLGDIADMVALVSNQYVIPGLPKTSELMKRIAAGTMPPTGKLPQDEIDVIEEWIARGALPTKVETEKRTFLRESVVYENAAKDLLGAFPAKTDRKFIRYLTLSHLYNAGVPRELIDTAGSGVSKLVNSLTWEAKTTPAKVVDDAKTLFRIDLRNYGWTASMWEDLVRSYAYLIVPPDAKALAVLQEDTGTSVPVLRGDWFLFNASRPPLYFKLLKLPDDLAELEKKLGVDSNLDLANKQVARAGFDNSSVAKNHRVLERHPAPNGFFWRSYEFGTKVGQKNVLQFPLGPQTGTARPADPPRIGAQPGPTFPLGPTTAGRNFIEDGGEFIFALPNKMMAFFLAANGKRLDQVPTDPGDMELIAGMSCMSCHGGGPIPKTDMVRELATQPQNQAVAEVIEAIYKTPAEFRELVLGDATAYREALASAGAAFETGDPVSRIAQGFPLDLSVAQAAAELGVEEAVLTEALKTNPALSGMAVRLQGRSIARKDFKELFPSLVAALKGKI